MFQPCVHWEERLATTRVNQLSPPEQKALQLHIQTCQTCFAMYTDCLVIDDYLQRTFASKQPAANVSGSVLPLYATRQHRPWLWQPGLRNAGWLRVAVFVGIVGIVVTYSNKYRKERAKIGKKRANPLRKRHRERIIIS